MIPTKRKIYVALAGIGLTLGGASIAGAAAVTTTQPVAAAVASPSAAVPTPTDPTAPADTAAATAPAASTTPPDHGGRGGPGDRAPSYTSSVTVPVAADGNKPTDAELQAVATVTSEQASAAALATMPGTAGAVELKSGAGNVVWEVDVTATAGGDYDVIVDAGNATVLGNHVEGGQGGHGGQEGRGGRGGPGNRPPAADAGTTTAAAAA